MYEWAINRVKLELALSKAKFANGGKEPSEDAVKAEYVKLAGRVREEAVVEKKPKKVKAEKKKEKKAKK